MSQKQIGGEPFPENKAVRTYEGMDQIYGPGKDNKAVLKPENIFAPMKETEQTLLDQIKEEVASRKHGCSYGNVPSSFRILMLDEIAERYATAKAKASCEATLKKAADRFALLNTRKEIIDPSNIVIL